MKLVRILSMMIASIPAAVFAQEVQTGRAQKSSYIKFEKEFCRDIGRHPTITVCVSNGDIDDKYRLNTKHLRRFKREAKKVLAEYKKLQVNFNQKYNTSTSSCTYDDWDPAECDLEDGTRSFCEVELGIPPGG